MSLMFIVIIFGVLLLFGGIIVFMIAKNKK